DFRALLHQTAHRFAIVERSRQVVFGPNVLANRYADFFPVNKKRLDALSRLKISLFIENDVSWQKRFVGFPDWFAAFEQSRGVTKRFAAPIVAINKSDEQRCIADTSVQLCQQLQIFRNETRYENQILWRISGHRQLGREHEFRARRREPLICAGDQIAISPQISHRRVNLSETNLHAALVRLIATLPPASP